MRIGSTRRPGFHGLYRAIPASRCLADGPRGRAAVRRRRAHHRRPLTEKRHGARGGRPRHPECGGAWRLGAITLDYIAVKAPNLGKFVLFVLNSVVYFFEDYCYFAMKLLYKAKMPTLMPIGYFFDKITLTVPPHPNLHLHLHCRPNTQTSSQQHYPDPLCSRVTLTSTHEFICRHAARHAMPTSARQGRK